MQFPADYDEWDSVVCAAYPLKKYIFENKLSRIKLFSSSSRARVLTNAPYLEEGGIISKDPSVNDGFIGNMNELFEEHNPDYVLLKSREQYFFNYLPKHDIDKDYYTFLLDMAVGKDKIWSDGIQSKVRNQIRKAKKNNFTIKFGRLELLNDFYSVLSLCWRDLGTPVHSYKFFKFILEKFKDKAFIAVQYDKNIPISSALLFNLNGVLSHPFAGTINQYKPSSANNLLYWNLIKYSCENGINTFDMGRCRLNQGTFHFKKSWGGKPVNIYYHYFLKAGCSVPKFDSRYYKIATGIWRYMPLTLANSLGPKFIYKIL